MPPSVQIKAAIYARAKENENGVEQSDGPWPALPQCPSPSTRRFPAISSKRHRLTGDHSAVSHRAQVGHTGAASLASSPLRGRHLRSSSARPRQSARFAHPTYSPELHPISPCPSGRREPLPLLSVSVRVPNCLSSGQLQLCDS
uniref:Uncharacterized protein n=1 Tax=Leersia perrieri TaxID=77586 RepID=A0A0D9V473_9ORYZ